MGKYELKNSNNNNHQPTETEKQGTGGTTLGALPTHTQAMGTTLGGHEHVMDPDKRKQKKKEDEEKDSSLPLPINDTKKDHESSSSGDDEDGSSDEGKADYRKGGYHPVSVGEVYKNRYQIINKLGWGHFSTVWRAFDNVTKKEVALKIVKSAKHYTEAAEDEITILQTVRDKDPNNIKCVVRLLDSFVHKGPHGSHVCMVFEVLGSNLLDLIKLYKYRGIPIPLVKSICKQVLIALDHLHTNSRIIHTDLKPENVLLDHIINHKEFWEKRFFPNNETQTSTSSTTTTTTTTTSTTTTSPSTSTSTSTSTTTQTDVDIVMTDNDNNNNNNNQSKTTSIPTTTQTLESAPQSSQFVSQSSSHSSTESLSEKTVSNSSPFDVDSTPTTPISISNEEEDDYILGTSDGDSKSLSNQRNQKKRQKKKQPAKPKPPQTQPPSSSIITRTVTPPLLAPPFYDPEKYPKAFLVDLGNACWIEKHFTDDIQTRQYRAPEVILGSKWSTPVDMWSMGCMVFELLTGDLLFEPKSSKHWDKNDDHLALMVELQGKVPRKVLSGGKHTADFFSKRGELKAIRNLGPQWGLVDVLADKYHYSREDASEIASFILPMIDWIPEKRCTAREALSHSWLKGVPPIRRDYDDG